MDDRKRIMDGKRKAVEEYEQAVEKMQDEIRQEWEKKGPVVEKSAKIMQAVEKMQDEIQQEWEKKGPIVEKSAKIMQDLAEKERSATVSILPPKPVTEVTEVHHHYHERQTQLDPFDQEKEELPIPEGKTKYSQEDWDKIFQATSGAGPRPDYFEIAKLTSRAYRTVKKGYGKWKDRKG